MEPLDRFPADIQKKILTQYRGLMRICGAEFDKQGLARVRKSFEFLLAHCGGDDRIHGIHLVEFSAGSVIITEGEVGNQMYVVMEGEAIISLKGKELARAVQGELIGEMALISSDIRSATVTARTDCTLARIDQKSFESMLRYVPDFSIYVINLLANRLQTAYEKIEQ